MAICACGCGQDPGVYASTRRGHRKGDPRLYVTGHNTRLPGIDYEGPDYLVEDRGYKTPCWIWQKGTTPAGYGRAYRPELRKQVYMHIWYWEQMHGTVPQGKHLDHLCRNPICINPDHLEPVSPRINVQRKPGGLTAEQVLIIRSSDRPRGYIKDFAQRFSVSEATIQDVILGRSWKNIYVCSNEGRSHNPRRRSAPHGRTHRKF